MRENIALCAMTVGCILVCWLASCATNPDGTLTDASRANLIALEQFALATAVQVGTQYMVAGSVDQATMVNSINAGASILQNTIATQNVQTPKAVANATEVAITAKSNKATRKIASEVGPRVEEAVKKGVPPQQAMEAASKGLKKGAAKLKQER